MLQHLSIRNYALIRSLEVDWAEGFSVITGETGAGKSILLGALGLVLGQRADSGILFDKSKKCAIEARFNVQGMDMERFATTENEEEAPAFDIEDGILVLRREILPNGKSRAFVNDTPVTLTLLKEVASGLVDIHSQHQTLTLNTSAFQLNLIDSYLDDNLLPLRYQQAYSAYGKVRQEVERLEAKVARGRQEEDYWQFLWEELEKFDPKPGEQEAMEEALERLSHGEQLKETLSEAVSVLDTEEFSLRSRLESMVRSLRKVAPYHKGVDESLERWDSLLVELADLSGDLERWSEEDLDDPALKGQYEERLDELYRLERKHRVQDEEGLIALKAELERKLAQVEDSSEALQEARKKLSSMEEELQTLADGLHQARSLSAGRLQEAIVGALGRLGMGQSRLEIVLEPQMQFGPTGKDKAIFLFSANPGSAPKELAKVASGGELSRLMLAIKSVIHRKSFIGTLILDEIDTGVSGRIAGKVAAMMREMSRYMQVVAITHLPQIAAAAEAHFFVYKTLKDGVGVSDMKRLDRREHVESIAGMLGNGELKPAAIQAAEELVEEACGKQEPRRDQRDQKE